VRRVTVTASASANGKTTLGRELARRLDVPFVELDALVHGPNWSETPDGELQELVGRVVATDGWVIDGTYRGKLGTLTLEHADLVVWLDLPLRVWLPRLMRRTIHRIRTREELWNGNRETFLNTFWGWNGLIVFSLRSHFRRRRDWPSELRDYPVVRLRSPAEVERFLAEFTSGSSAPERPPQTDG
jgi:adenylate kinase family enzyme